MTRSRSSRRRRSRLGALPLTSMIDVVFLLLVFFLVTADFAKKENKLPSALQTEGGGVQSSDMQPQIIRISVLNGESVFTIGQVRCSDRASLESVLGQLPREPGVAIKAEPDVPIQSIATALQAARNAGFARRSYVPGESSD